MSLPPSDGDRVWVHMAGGVAAVGVCGHTACDRECRCPQVLRCSGVHGGHGDGMWVLLGVP